MPIIALASSKGGCGKSTTALILASAYLADGYKITIIDADPRKRLFKWFSAGNAGSGINVIAADVMTLRKSIKEARSSADLVLIDLEGTKNAETTVAVAAADYTIVPANPSAPDVEDAIETVMLLRSLEDHERHGVLWCRVPTTFISRESLALQAQVAAARIPIIGGVTERTAYKSMYSFGTTLHGLNPKHVPGLKAARAEALVLATQVAEAMRLAQAGEEDNA